MNTNVAICESVRTTVPAKRQMNGHCCGDYCDRALAYPDRDAEYRCITIHDAHLSINSRLRELI
ncbi:MAG: hypothetical protein JWQ86_2733, partial [Mycobacterium sp.]|nr:hypothetical protein [Mycobacterium sp.]